MSRWRIGVTLLALAFLSASVPGDDQPSKPGVGLPAYYGKLGLREGQKQTILKLRAGFKAKTDDLQRQIDKLKGEEKEALEKVLTKGQRKRLHQMRDLERPTEFLRQRFGTKKEKNATEKKPAKEAS